MLNVNNKFKWANIIAFTAMVAVNILADVIPIGGYTTAEVSKIYPNLFTPAPFTFAIWGVIYILLAGFAFLYQTGVIDHNPRFTERILGWFILSCAMNIGWLLSWHFDAIGLSVLFMLGLLISIIAMNERTDDIKPSLFESLVVKLPLGLYFGWITVATIANISVWFVSIGVSLPAAAEQIVTVIIMLIGTGIAGIVLTLKEDPFYGIAVAWGYAGIIVRHIVGGGYPVIVAAAIVSVLIVLSLTVSPLFGGHKREPSESSKNAQTT